MQVAALQYTGWPVAGRRRIGAGAITFAAVALLTLLVELALVERKYAIFGGGFGQSRTLDAAPEIAAFFIGLLTAHLLLLYGIYRLLRRLHGTSGGTPLFYFNFLFLVPGAAFLVLGAKFKLLSYFSDALSFEIIRNLGGGTLTGAFSYVLSEAGLLLLGFGGLALVYAAAFRLFRRHWPKGAQAGPSLRLGGSQLLLLLAATPLMLFAAAGIGDARPALMRFNAFAVMAGGLDMATDFDQDGYGFFSHRIDLHPFDAARHPLALDVPGNGIDEDGFGGDFAFDGAEPVEAAPVVTRRKHVVLIVLESARGDLVGKRYGGRTIAPNIEKMAREGTLVRQAYSHVGFTSASLKSLFTGALEPVAGGPSLFRDMASNGYRVGVFSGLAERFGDIDATVGMRKHSDVYVDAETLRDERAFGFATTASLLVDGQILLREFDRNFSHAPAWQTPNFLYFNFQSAHFPYHNPGVRPFIPGDPIPRSQINLANRDWVARTYWNSVAYGDWLVGQVVERLRARGVYDDSVVIVTGDHGESLFEDGFLGHGHMINRRQTHIPLVLNVPGVAVAEPIGLSDMRGLILSLLGTGRPPAGISVPVFQYIGSLDAPGAIGMVDRTGIWVTLDLESEEVRSSGSGMRGGYRALPPDHPLKASADRLVAEWARQRWIRHLGGARS